MIPSFEKTVGFIDVVEKACVDLNAIPLYTDRGLNKEGGGGDYNLAETPIYHCEKLILS